MAIRKGDSCVVCGCTAELTRFDPADPETPLICKTCEAADNPIDTVDPTTW